MGLIDIPQESVKDLIIDLASKADPINITGTHDETVPAIDFSIIQGKKLTLTEDRSFTITGLTSSNIVGLLDIPHNGNVPSFSGVTELDTLLNKSGSYYLKFTRLADGTIIQTNQAVTLVKSVANKILSADLLTSNTTPIVIKTAGGAGILDKPTEGWIYLDFGIAYTTYTTLELVSGSTVVGTCNCLGLTTSGWYPIVFSGTPEENAALSIRTQTDDPPGGTSNIAYDISYEEKDVSIFSFPVNIEFGENVLLPSTTTNDNRKGQQVIVPFDCDISSLTFYQEGGAASNILVSVYDNVADEPLNRLGLSASTPIDGAPGWQTVPLITPVSVSAGDVIWLNWVPDGQLVYGFESPTSGLKWIGSNTYTFPDPIDGPVTTAAASYNIYCNAIRT